MRAHHTLAAVALLLVSVAAGPVFAQPAPCTQQTVVGTYALAVQGSTRVGQAMLPFASLSIVSIDAEGVMSGTGYGAFAGQVGQAPVVGTIQVNPDCTAVVTTSSGTGSTDIILDGGDELVALMLQFPVGSPSLTGRARRITRAPVSAGLAPCHAASIRGTYAAAYQGSYLMPAPTPPIPVGMVATVSIDAEGQVTGGGTISLAGQAMPYEIASGLATPGDDCTATVELRVTSGGLTDTGKSWLVVFGEGQELWAIQTESAATRPVVAGIWKRMSR